MANSIIAVVGGESLLGREVRDLFQKRKTTAQVKLISSVDRDEILTAKEEQVGVMASLLAEELVGASVILLAGGPASSEKTQDLVRGWEPAPVLIDLTGSLEDNPAARLIESSAVRVIAHPASIALALFLTRLQQLSAIRRAVVLICEPASERGQAGIDELHRQTIGLLSFQKMPMEVYDAQVSFNVLPQYGEESAHSLASIELRIERNLASLLLAAGNVPMPSLRVVQAPVFHGYSFSVWVEFEERPEMPAMLKQLASKHIDVRARNEAAPANVGVAGQGGITVGSVTADRNDSRAFWFWVVSDNLRVAAESAVEVAIATIG